MAIYSRNEDRIVLCISLWAVPKEWVHAYHLFNLLIVEYQPVYKTLKIQNNNRIMMHNTGLYEYYIGDCLQTKWKIFVYEA
jgi:hypothetical protein